MTRHAPVSQTIRRPLANGAGLVRYFVTRWCWLQSPRRADGQIPLPQCDQFVQMTGRGQFLRPMAPLCHEHQPTRADALATGPVSNLKPPHAIAPENNPYWATKYLP